MSGDFRLSDRITLNATETAKVMGISRPTLYALMHREDFPCIRPTGPGGRVLIPVDGLKAWVAAQQEKTEVQV